MQSIAMILAFFFATLSGCATLHHTDPATGNGYSYSGTARGATTVMYASDQGPYTLAQSAIDAGLAPSLIREANGNVRFSAYPLVGVNGVWQSGGTTTYVPGVGLVRSGANPNRLPPLAGSPIVAGVPSGASSDMSGAIVPCPEDRPARNVAEQAACAQKTASTAIRVATGE